MVSLRNFEPTARTFPRATLAPLDKALVMMIKAGRHTLPQLCRSVSIRMIIAIHQPSIRDDAMREADELVDLSIGQPGPVVQPMQPAVVRHPSPRIDGIDSARVPPVNRRCPQRRNTVGLAPPRPHAPKP